MSRLAVLGVGRIGGEVAYLAAALGMVDELVLYDHTQSLLKAQVLDLQPAQGGFVEFTFDVPSLYPFVTHKFASASKGAVGLFQAGDVPEPEGGAAH